jgi:hypothetical protein
MSMGGIPPPAGFFSSGCRAAASHNSLFDRGFGGIDRIFNLQFQIFHFGFSRRTNSDHRHATRKFSDPFIKFFFIKFVVVASR